jgi:hypothetical protein
LSLVEALLLPVVSNNPELGVNPVPTLTTRTLNSSNNRVLVDTMVNRWDTSKAVVISKEDMVVTKQVDRVVTVDTKEELVLLQVLVLEDTAVLPAQVDTSKADSPRELNSSNLSKPKTRHNPNNPPLSPVDNPTSPLRRARHPLKPSA